MRLTEEHRNALINAARDDSTKIIEYFEEKEAAEKKKWKKRLLINLLYWLGGIATVLITQYLGKVLELS